jgi:TonB family protein
MIFASQAVRQPRRGWMAFSTGLHAVAFWTFLQAPALRLPRPSESEYRLKIAGKEDQIVYFKFRRELPQVTPPKANPMRDPLRAEVKARQTIVSSPKNAPKAERMVWTPAPEIKPVPMELPNLLAIRLPDPPPKPFVAPPEIARPEVAKVELPDAPEMKPQAPVTAEMKPPPLPNRQFVRPAVAPRPLPAAPQIASDAPTLEAQSETAALLPSSKLPPKPFTAPRGSTGTPAASGQGHDVGAPPPVDASNSRDLNIAIVGLNPKDNASILPSASSPGRFSAGPVVRPNGADTEGGGKGLSVPDLFVRGTDPRKDGKPDLIAQAYAAPTAAGNLRAAMSRGEPMIPHVEAAPDPARLPSGATRVSGAPDPRFSGREVFMMAIQMPNITSYSGSWLMWYSDRTLREAGLAPIAPPVAHRKVDPKYIATAVEERVEGRVTLACVVDKQGRVSGVELVRGIDDRLNKSAEEALSKWEFFPATRKGEPVDVDVLVEIPFHLAPRVPK